MRYEKRGLCIRIKGIVAFVCHTIENVSLDMFDKYLLHDCVMGERKEISVTK